MLFPISSLLSSCEQHLSSTDTGIYSASQAIRWIPHFLFQPNAELGRGQKRNGTLGRGETENITLDEHIIATGRSAGMWFKGEWNEISEFDMINAIIYFIYIYRICLSSLMWLSVNISALPYMHRILYKHGEQEMQRSANTHYVFS